MAKHTDILYRLARFLAGVPPDTLGAVVLYALERFEITAFLSAIVLFVLKCLVGLIFPVVLLVLEYLLGLTLDVLVTWYLGKMFAIYVWPKLPRHIQQLLRAIEGRILLQPPDEGRAGRRDEQSTFSRNSKRHPHW